VPSAAGTLSPTSHELTGGEWAVLSLILTAGIGTGVAVGLTEHSVKLGILWGLAGAVITWLILLILLRGPMKRVTLFVLGPLNAAVTAVTGLLGWSRSRR
jgi:hypothetical protein